MADKLEEDIQRYKDLWTDIQAGGIADPLPSLDESTYLKELANELRDSYSDNSPSAIKNQLETYHKVTKQVHYLRDILSITGSYMYNLRGLKNVIEEA